jgi:pyrroline-5-carboxylate reductase
MIKILLIGCGNLGQALCSAWRLTGEYEVSVVDRGLQNSSNAAFASVADIPENYIPEIAVLAVKPQQMDAALAEIVEKFSLPLREKIIWLSVAAGFSMARFSASLGDVPLVRTMPNLPAVIGAAVTALYANEKISAVQKKSAEKLMSAIGKNLWLEDEAQINAVTAISGSGPAYVCYFQESLIAASVDLGLTQEVAKFLAAETILGTVELLRKTQKNAADLRKQVTSKGGTTEAALAVLSENNQWQKILSQAANAAFLRAVELK